MYVSTFCLGKPYISSQTKDSFSVVEIIVGCVVGVVVCIIIVSLLILLMWYQRMRKIKKKGIQGGYVSGLHVRVTILSLNYIQTYHAIVYSYSSTYIHM